MDFTQFAQNYSGPVLFTCIGAEERKTQTGSVALRLKLVVDSIAEGYDLEKFQDPTGFALTDDIWLPMESDKGQKTKSGADKYAGKATTVYKALVGWGFDGDRMPDYEEFEGLTAYGALAIDKESGDPVVQYRSYKAV